ncbi:MAG: nucleotidyltransferase family protein [Candidatus ainarchaeum sp.]|nr:nucleotidyltransferase family protein [Candidatus ainarchaeum sp.]
MKAFVLCGGQGTRLRPYTYSLPKPMLKMGRKPILQYVVENLRLNGFTDLILTVGYKKEAIKEYFGDGKKFGVEIEYAEEDEPKNTAGSILDYKGKIKESFLVVMGDHLTDINLRDMMAAHKKSGAIATMALTKKEMQLEYGIVEVKNSQVASFSEKPKYDFLVNTAIYAFEPAIFEYIKPREDFAKHVFPRVLAAKKKINPYMLSEYWVDVGRVSDYERLNEFLNVTSLLKNLDLKEGE